MKFCCDHRTTFNLWYVRVLTCFQLFCTDHPSSDNQSDEKGFFALQLVVS